MKHQTLEELQNIAEVDCCPNAMSREERLRRWAERLESNPNRRLFTLHQTEYRSAAVRDEMRGDGTPLSIAFQDPMLRAAGLTGDTFGEAKRFFELTDAQLHDVICYCHFGETMSAGTAARNIRAIAAGTQPGTFASVRDTFVG